VPSNRTRPATDALRRQINSILDDLYGLNCISSYNISYLDEDSGRISWARKSEDAMITDFDHITVDNYLQWADQDDYSALLPDGSMLQLTYTLSGSTIVGHRLCYVPSPITSLGEWAAKPEKETWLGSDYAVIVSDRLADSHEHAALRSVVRFDYDPANAAKGHPASHLTINSVDCRIPCIAPLTPGEFISFIFEHFYPAEKLRLSSFFDSLPTPKRKENLIPETHAHAIHVAW
jgi:hypothetical protein